MARLASQAKMGFYPTPPLSLARVAAWVRPKARDRDEPYALLDPCCGEGQALKTIANQFHASQTWGIEPDVDRAMQASQILQTVVQGSIFDARINPLACMGLLWLNPPYDTEGRVRSEVTFLKHAHKWLVPGGVLVFIVPEAIIQDEQTARWIGRHYTRLKAFRLVTSEYPLFRQVVLFGLKRPAPVEPEAAEILPAGPYPHLDAPNLRVVPYEVPATHGPSTFQAGDTITDEDLSQDASKLQDDIAKLCATDRLEAGALSPLLPLRKGHLVALLTAGLLDGRVAGPHGDLVIKGYSSRVQHTREEPEEGKEITTDTYAVGIRVLDLAKGSWYDIR
ncbi:MAG: DUF6094 domain-containing protein [Nitrospirota bacterium]